MKFNAFYFKLVFVFIVCFFYLVVQRFFVSKPEISHDQKVISLIVESDQLDDIKQYINQDKTLVVFDLDNTLVAPKLEIGTEQWFNYTLRHMQNGHKMQDAIDALLPLFFQINQHIPLYLTENIIPELLQSLYKQDIPVIAVTARSDILKDCTIKQLCNAGIELPFIGFGEKEIKETFRVPMSFVHGIIFSANNDKGLLLFYILDQVGYRPNKIIFVDDKYNNVAMVARACAEHKVPFVGIRYSRLDERVAQFDSVKAEQQLQDLLGHNLDGCIKQAQIEIGTIY